MSATEDDAALALRGYVIARTGCLPTDRAFQELSRNELLLQFTVHWLQKRDTDLMDTVMKLLGTVWTRDEVVQMSGQENAAAPERVYLPLALGCNPELGEQLKQLFRVGKGPFIGAGEYVPQPGEDVVELADLPVEQFKQWAQMATGAGGEPTSQPAITLGSDKVGDAKLDRMREQVAHSKRFR